MDLQMDRDGLESHIAVLKLEFMYWFTSEKDKVLRPVISVFSSHTDTFEELGGHFLVIF